MTTGGKFRLAFGLAVVSITGTSMVMAEKAVTEPMGALNVNLPRVEGVDAETPTVEMLDYLVVRQASSALFEALARDLELRLDLSDGVHGTLSDRRLTGTREEVLEAAAKDLGLDWFIFNGVLYVSDGTEALTRIVRMGDLKPEKVMTVLAESGLETERLDVESSAGGTALALSGPPKLLALAEAIIEGIPPPPVDRVVESPARIVTVRRGNAAERVQLP
jgi:hypothetical protein